MRRRTGHFADRHITETRTLGFAAEMRAPAVVAAGASGFGEPACDARGEAPAVIQRLDADQKQFDQRMQKERATLQREHQNELKKGRAGVPADQVRQQQQAELKAQQDREAKERRTLEQRRKIAQDRQHNQGQGQSQGNGNAQGQDKAQGQGQGNGSK